MPVKDVRTVGRATQGVTLFKVAKGEQVVSVAWLVEDDDEDVIEGEEVIEKAVDPSDDTPDENSRSKRRRITYSL